jgi:hypothetical protein
MNLFVCFPQSRSLGKRTFWQNQACVTFSKIDHIIGHKTGLNRYKNIEIIPCILSDHQGLRLVFNSKKKKTKKQKNKNNNNKKNRQPTYTWKLNNFLLNDSLVNEELDKEIKNFRI